MVATVNIWPQTLRSSFIQTSIFISHGYLIYLFSLPHYINILIHWIPSYLGLYCSGPSPWEGSTFFYSSDFPHPKDHPYHAWYFLVEQFLHKKVINTGVLRWFFFCQLWFSPIFVQYFNEYCSFHLLWLKSPMIQCVLSIKSLTKTTNPNMFYFLHLYQESEQSCICVLRMDFALFYNFSIRF